MREDFASQSQPVLASNGQPDAEPSAPVRLIRAGWHDEGDDPEAEPERRFQLILEFEGEPPKWPLGWLFDGAFTLTHRVPTPAPSDTTGVSDEVPGMQIK